MKKGVSKAAALVLSAAFTASLPLSAYAATTPNYNSDNPFVVSSELSHYTGTSVQPHVDPTPAGNDTTTTYTPVSTEEPVSDAVNSADQLAEDPTTRNPSVDETTVLPWNGSDSNEYDAAVDFTDASYAEQTNESSGAVSDYTGYDMTVVSNNLVAKPKHVYEQDGRLYAELYLINGFNRPVAVTGTQDILFFANGRQIGHANRTLSQNIKIGAGGNAVYTVVLSGSEYTAGADLTDLTVDAALTYAWA